MSSCFPFLRKRRRATDKGVSWRQLLTLKGPDLWTVRKLALDRQCVKLPTNSDHRNDESVCVLSSTSRFQQLEKEHDMEKTVTQGGARPLTRCTGDEWTRQRRLVKAAFCDIPDRSLMAVEHVNFQGILKQNKTVDLKQVVLDASLGWVVRLFRGQDDKKLENTCFRFWMQIRAQQKNYRSVKKARKKFVRSLQWDSGVLGEFVKSGLSSKEATDNAVNAMIAALDAVQSLVFWTIWNLARTDGAWERCRSGLLLDKDADIQQQDLLRLADLKKQATQGELVQWTGLSYLGRALAETVRVYPPVWTLPRAWPCDNTVIAVKMDVPTTNGALDRDWDPCQERKVLIASFGLGKRHCPAGTAALYAAYMMIRRFVLSFESAKECEADKALCDAYLGPTLCVHGPQFFLLEYSTLFEFNKEPDDS